MKPPHRAIGSRVSAGMITGIGPARAHMYTGSSLTAYSTSE